MIYNISPHTVNDTWGGIPLITFTKNNSAIDLTGAEINFVVSKAFNVAAPPVLTLSTNNSGIKIISPSLGKISIPSQVIKIPVGQYQWSLTLTLTSGEIKTYLMGDWSINPRIPLDINQNVYDHYPIVE